MSIMLSGIGDRGCTGKTRLGKPCNMPALRGRPVCFNHDPLRARDRVAARKLGGRNRRGVSKVDATNDHEEPTSLRNAEDVRREAEKLLAETKMLSNSARRTTAVVSVLTLALKGLEAGEFEERLQTLEQQLERQRREIRR